MRSFELSYAAAAVTTSHTTPAGRTVRVVSFFIDRGDLGVADVPTPTAAAWCRRGWRTCATPRCDAPGQASRFDPDELADGSIAAGLYLLSLVTLRGVELTQEEMATACGRSRAMIYIIEKRAMRRPRRPMWLLRQLESLW